jgi:hypothetical protein
VEAGEKREGRREQGVVDNRPGKKCEVKGVGCQEGTAFFKRKCLP